MAKPKLLFRGPVLTSSGYGVHARQLLRAVFDSGIYDVSVESIKWGETPFIYGEEVSWIDQLTENRRRDSKDLVYDVSVQVTIPNEFEKRAKFNVGVTAGIEVDAVSPEWLSKANQVDLLIVPSHHSLNAFRIAYRAQTGEELRLTTQAVVVHEGFDPEVFFPGGADQRSELLDHVETSKNLLHVGLGLDKPLGEDRKNISSLVKWFLEEFKGDREHGLILKTSVVNNSLLDYELVKRRIGEIRHSVGCGEFPRIYLVHGRLTDAQLASIYRDPRVSAFISLTHGEGFGLPLLEAAASGLPVVATGWSGHVDFLKLGAFAPIPFDLAAVPRSCVWPGVIEEGRGWANPREADVKRIMRLTFSEHELGKNLAVARRQALLENFSISKVGKDFVDVLNAARKAFQLSRPENREELAVAVKSMLLADEPEGKKMIFTMPVSGGDVYLSTAVVAALKRRHPDHRLIFATSAKYFSILEGNKCIDKIIEWQPWMQDVSLLEDVFDEVYTPNLAIQMTWSNWVHKGKGRQLLDEMFVQCGLDPDNQDVGPSIDYLSKPYQGELPDEYIVLHTGSGKGQWGARSYRHWQDVVDNLLRWVPGVKVVQVGLDDEPLIKGCVDLRGKTPDYRQLANVVSQSRAFLGIDSMCMHMAHHMNIGVVAVFGGSYPSSTGPLCGITSPRRRVQLELLETPDRKGCDRACYKDQCRVDKDDPCINNVNPATVLERIVAVVTNDYELSQRALADFSRNVPKISGYVHVLNPQRNEYPYIASIKSMLGFCQEVVVVDGGSDDGTLDFLEKWAAGEDRLKVFVNKWDPEEPGMDGMQKAFGRAMCDSSSEFLWQQDADEVVHEEDYQKILELCRRFPSDQVLMHLPVIELWGDEQTVRTDRHAWKWRLSRNDFRITHGIVNHARVIDQKTGRVYSKPGQSDGCEYIDVMTGEYVPHFGFWDRELEELRTRDPDSYGEKMNEVFAKLPSVFHYSWSDIARKIRNFKNFWNTQWSTLYADSTPVDRFPEQSLEDPLGIIDKAEEIRKRGGEHGPAKTFALKRTKPSAMEVYNV